MATVSTVDLSRSNFKGNGKVIFGEMTIRKSGLNEIVRAVSLFIMWLKMKSGYL